eukprot:874520-Prymnesium_polylepis.1
MEWNLDGHGAHSPRFEVWKQHLPACTRPNRKQVNQSSHARTAGARAPPRAPPPAFSLHLTYARDRRMAHSQSSS